MKRLKLGIDLTSVIVIITVGVLLPVLLSTAVGIVALVMARDAGHIVTGVLVICFAVAALGSALVTVVLTGRKMRLARRQADFIAGMSHELRTPLSAIRLYTQTLQSGQLNDNPARAAECLETIRRETEWLDALLDRVLTWRAAARDRLPLHYVTRPVDAAVRDALARFRSMVPADEVDLTSEMATTLRVRHDVSGVNAVILNLLTNAYKYSGAHKCIALVARDVAEGVEIEVRDNGVGMTPAEVKRIFQPFYRGKTGDGVARTGSGLGLSISRHLVQQHGGTIRVASKPGEGSVFTIALPRAGEGGPD